MEYAVVLAAVVAALLSMQIYMKRGFSGRLRAAADTAGEQYDPRNTSGSFTLKSKSETTTTVQSLNEPQLKTSPFCNGDCACADLNGDGDCSDDRVFGTVTEARLTGDGEETKRTGNETVGALGTDLWN